MPLDFEREYPLSLAVWHNDVSKLRQLLQCHSNVSRVDMEAKDPRGRTPLMLAVTLGHVECALLLLEQGGDATAENRSYWSVAHEAVATGDPELMQAVLQYREWHRAKKTKEAMAQLLGKLSDTPDFYAEMKWEFTSWLPFVSRICPSDTYKVYKRGSTVRIDTTLIGFDASNQWQRGDQSFIFRMVADSNMAEMIRIDHQLKSVTIERMKLIAPTQEGASGLEDVRSFRASETELCDRLTAPIVTTYVDVEKISFERSKSGLPGWRSDRAEDINGYHCKVYSASNVDLVTKTRTEHLTERDKTQQDARNSTPLDSLLKFVQGTETKQKDEAHEDGPALTANPFKISAEDYFNGSLDLNGKDIGRPKEVSTRCNSFKATLWLCNDFPLSLQQQVTPIIDLMASNNAHFARLKNFIELQLPAGFPVKIEIPLFHVINAHITFGNIFAQDTPVPHVAFIKERLPDNEELPVKSCVIDECIFEIPPSYRQTILDEEGAYDTSTSGVGSRHNAWGAQNEDDLLLQFAIQQSLAGTDGTAGAVDNGSVPASLPTTAPDMDAALQRAICHSLQLGDDMEYGEAAGVGIDADLARAIELSKKEEEERMRRENELLEEQMNAAIQLSLLEK